MVSVQVWLRFSPRLPDSRLLRLADRQWSASEQCSVEVRAIEVRQKSSQCHIDALILNTLHQCLSGSAYILPSAISNVIQALV